MRCQFRSPLVGDRCSLDSGHTGHHHYTKVAPEEAHDEKPEPVAEAPTARCDAQATSLSGLMANAWNQCVKDAGHEGDHLFAGPEPDEEPERCPWRETAPARRRCLLVAGHEGEHIAAALCGEAPHGLQCLLDLGHDGDHVVSTDEAAALAAHEYAKAQVGKPYTWGDLVRGPRLPWLEGAEPPQCPSVAMPQADRNRGGPMRKCVREAGHEGDHVFEPERCGVPGNGGSCTRDEGHEGEHRYAHTTGSGGYQFLDTTWGDVDPAPVGRTVRCPAREHGWIGRLCVLNAGHKIDHAWQSGPAPDLHPEEHPAARPAPPYDLRAEALRLAVDWGKAVHADAATILAAATVWAEHLAEG